MALCASAIISHVHKLVILSPGRDGPRPRAHSAWPLNVFISDSGGHLRLMALRTLVRSGQVAEASSGGRAQAAGPQTKQQSRKEDARRFGALTSEGAHRPPCAGPLDGGADMRRPRTSEPRLEFARNFADLGSGSTTIETGNGCVRHGCVRWADST